MKCEEKVRNITNFGESNKRLSALYIKNEKPKAAVLTIEILE